MAVTGRAWISSSMNGCSAVYHRIGVGDGGICPLLLQKWGKYFFSGKYRVKFGHFVSFLYIFWGQKCLAPQSWLSSYARDRIVLLRDQVKRAICTTSTNNRIVRTWRHRYVINVVIGSVTPKFLGGPNPPRYLLSPPSHLSCIAFPSACLPSFPSLPLKLDPLKIAMGLGRAVSSPRWV